MTLSAVTPARMRTLSVIASCGGAQMRIFVTGASGWIGSAVVPELLKAGHEVTGLARSDGAAAKLEAWGVHVLRGGLDDLGALQRGASNSDGVIHLAYEHATAFTPDGFAQAAASDRQAI